MYQINLLKHNKAFLGKSITHSGVMKGRRGVVCVLETKAARLCINGTPSITSGVTERGAKALGGTGPYNFWIKDITSVVFFWCPETSASDAPHLLTVSLFLFSSGGNTRGKAEGL